jgi:glycine/D-amino acid oxidase-like deaminating enzyme
MALSSRVNSFPNDGVNNGWYNTLPEPPLARELIGTLTFDWAIVGAGICGLSVARRLAELRPSDSIAVIDAMRVGYGTSGRNAGFMLSHHSHGGVADLDIGRRNDRLLSAGYETLRTIVRDNQIRCDWNEWGQVYVSVASEGETRLAAVAKSFAALDVDFERLDRDQLEHMTGTRFYSGAIRVGDSALVQPAALMRGLAHTLPANVCLLENSPVQELHAEDRYRLVCPSGELTAKKLILTNNVFAEEFGVARRQVVPMATYASLTRTLSPRELRGLGEEGEFGLLPASQNGSTVRRTADGRLLMRNTLSYARENAFAKEWIREVETHHRDSVRRRWPALGEVDFIATWGGILGFTRNEGTVFGEVAHGLYVTLSTDTAPMTRGTIMGKLLAEQIGGVQSEELRLLESVPKATRLPPEFILRFVANRRIKKFEKVGAQER